MSTDYYSQINQTSLVERFSNEQISTMEAVEKVYPFRSNEYYLSLINYQNPHDPLKKIILPDERELKQFGTLDPSDEETYTPIPGVQHKYPHTALMMVNNTCAGICRFCFRKRLFTKESSPPTGDICKATDYLQEKQGISEVILSGGDPLMLQASKLDQILSKIREVAHISTVRIGTKVPAYDPHRLTDTDDICEVIAKHTSDDKKIYVISHFNHPHEITESSRAAISSLKKTGAELVNQTPILEGINNSPETLATLFNLLSNYGVSPYYVFQCRPTSGNWHHTVPIEQALQVIHTAQAQCSGLAKRARYIMSHKSGKIEVVGKTSKHIFMKYHQAASPDDLNSMLVYKPNSKARWLEDYHQRLTDMVPKMTWLF